MRDAALAAHRARRPGTGPVEVFDQTMRAELVERDALEERLTVALANAELTMPLQPIVTPGLVHIQDEALLRCHLPEGTLVPPAPYIPATQSRRPLLTTRHWFAATHPSLPPTR